MKELYLAPSGNDVTGDGSAHAPFQSLPRAVIQARAEQDAVTLRLHGGTYFMEQALTLTQEDAGLTIAACEGESPELSGAMPLAGMNWSDYKGNPAIKQCALRPGLKIDRLYLNRQEQILARFPNYREGVLPLGGVATRAQIKERAAGYHDPAGGYLRAMHPSGWGGTSYKITGKDSGSKLGLSYWWVGDNNRGSAMRDQVVIENVFEELDEPGEWFYDDETGVLYVWPPEGCELASASVEASVTTQLIRIAGTLAHPACDITIEGIRFFGTKRTMFTVNEPGMAYTPLLRGDWCVVRAGAAYLANCERVRFQNDAFCSLGGNGIFMSSYQKENTVDACDFVEIGATAVQICGLPEAVHEPSFWPHDKYPDLTVHRASVRHPDQRGPKGEEYPRDVVVSNCHMQKLGVFEKQAAGVNLSVSSRIKILHCTIHESARSDININDGTFGGHEIAYNDIYDAQRETTDHGPFNAWGRDRFWSVPRYNAAGEQGKTIRHYQTPRGTFDIALLDAYQLTTIHDNRFHHDLAAPHTWGIDLDDGASHYDVYNNLCLGMGIKLREGFARRIHNNILVDGQIQLHVPYEDAEDRIESNLIVNSTPYGFAGADEKRLHDSRDIIDRNWLVPRAEKLRLPKFFHQNNPKNPWDAYAVVGEDPAFANVLTGDYTVTNQAAMEQAGFSNFAMDQFGAPGCGFEPPVYTPVVPQEQAAQDAPKLEKWRHARICDVDDAIRSSTAYGGETGVYFAYVRPRSRVYEAGFRERDIVVSFEGCAVDHPHEFLSLCRQLHHKTVHLRIHRDNAMQELIVRLP